MHSVRDGIDRVSRGGMCGKAGYLFVSGARDGSQGPIGL